MRGKFDAPTICWECWNAVPDKDSRGCNWSRNLEPVEGWKAEPTSSLSQGTHHGKHYEVVDNSYRVISCPEFVKG